MINVAPAVRMAAPQYLPRCSPARAGTIPDLSPQTLGRGPGRHAQQDRNSGRVDDQVGLIVRVTVLIDTTDVPFKGALVYGVAELDYEDVIPKRVAIFEKRLSRDEAETYARRLSGKWQCVIVRITPVHIASFDYSKA